MSAIKRRWNIGVGRESLRGTKCASAMWLKPTVFDVQRRSVTVDTPRGMGVIEDSDNRVVTKNFSEGKIGGEVLDQSIGYFLLAALGAVSSGLKDGEASVYEHAFSVLQGAQHPSLTIEAKKDTLEQVAYPLACVDQFSLEAAVNDYVNFEASLRAKDSVAANGTPSYVAENHFLAKHISVKLAANLAGLDAASAIDVRNLKLVLAKNLEDKDLLASGEPSDFLVRQLAITGSLELYFESLYYRDYAMDGTAKAMRITLDNTAVTIGSSSTPKLVIDLAKVQFGEAVETGGNNDHVKLVAPFKGFYSLTDAKSIIATLTNTKADYTA